MDGTISRRGAINAVHKAGITEYDETLAIEALEKQIPTRPVVPIDTWLCPSCGESVEYQQMLGDNVLYHGQHDFCPKCGQKIDWEWLKNE